MYSDKIRLVKEKFYKQSLLFLIIGLSTIVIALIKCCSYTNGVEVFISIFTSINAIGLTIYIFLLLALIYYMRYRYNINRRKKFLEHGKLYKAIIEDTYNVVNWFGQGRQGNYKMVIRYDGNKTFVTPAYESDTEYIIVSNDCNVYVLNGKCYASDFNVQKKSKYSGEIIEEPRVNEEEFLVNSIKEDCFNRKEFLEGRVKVYMGKSERYIMPVPIPATFRDGITKSIVIDVEIQSDNKVEVFLEFRKELSEYIINTAKSISYEQIHDFKAGVEKKLYELLRTYYYFVKIKSVSIGEI